MRSCWRARACTGSSARRCDRPPRGRRIQQPPPRFGAAVFCFCRVYFSVSEISPIASAMSRFTPSTFTVSSPNTPSSFVLGVVRDDLRKPFRAEPGSLCNAREAAPARRRARCAGQGPSPRPSSGRPGYPPAPRRDFPPETPRCRPPHARVSAGLDGRVVVGAGAQPRKFAAVVVDTWLSPSFVCRNRCCSDRRRAGPIMK